MNFGELIAKGGALFARKGADALADTLETAPAGDLARIQASVSGYLNLSTTDAAGNSAKIVAAGGGILQPGTWPIAPINATVDITLGGAGKHRALLVSTADVAGYLIKSTGRVCISDIGVRGMHNTVKGNLTAAAGLQSGALLDARNGSYIKDCAVYGFGATGVAFVGDSSANDLGPVLSGSDIYNNYIGLDTGNGISTGRGEYAKIFGNTILENTYGIVVRSGNVNISGANSLQYNGENIWVVGAADNGAHGIITGNMINHAYRVTIRLTNCGFGQIVTNNAMFSNTASIIQQDCTGVQFNGNLIFAAAIQFSGNFWNSFADNVFYGAMPTITDTSGAVWRDNYSMLNYSYVDKTGAMSNKSSFQASPSLTYVTISGPSGANKCTNGAFDSSAGWTAQAGWSIGGGVAAATNCNSYLFTAMSGGVAASTQYQVDLDLTRSAGNIRIGVGGNVVSTQISTAGPVSIVLTTSAGANDSNVYIAAENGFTGSVDNISVRIVATKGDLTSTNVGATEYVYVGTTRYFSGAGTPEGVVTAAVGSEYTRTDGTAGTSAVPGTLKYVKTSGAAATGWTAVL